MRTKERRGKKVKIRCNERNHANQDWEQVYSSDMNDERMLQVGETAEYRYKDDKRETEAYQRGRTKKRMMIANNKFDRKRRGSEDMYDVGAGKARRGDIEQVKARD